MAKCKCVRCGRENCNFEICDFCNLKFELDNGLLSKEEILELIKLLEDYIKRHS
jgi:hypothetical protein